MTQSIVIQKYGVQGWVQADDLLAEEEPLEISIEYGATGERRIRQLSITMRSPGEDEDLVCGFLLTEGIISSAADLARVLATGPNNMLVSLRPEARFDMGKLERHFYTTSSCGVCGKSSIDAIQCVVNPSFSKAEEHLSVAAATLCSLPDRLRDAQKTFNATGGLHASAIFGLDGSLLALREDVGRHNALDKLIGHFLRQDALPLHRHCLLLSGRASFELIQKAAMAGIRLVCAVGAPSSLAAATAASFNITLIGFLRENRFNVYHSNKDISII